MHVKKPGLITTRRNILRAGAGLAVVMAAPPIIGRATASTIWTADPFSLGVACGDPMPGGFVLWTRLAPDPLSSDGSAPWGLEGRDIAVRYEISDEPSFKTLVQSGTAVAEHQYAYSVHLEVQGLKPGRPYWYRFQSGPAQSRIGKAMTAPEPGAKLDRLKFGFVSCANYELGYFSAYRHLADEQPDFVVFLGDYIYEYASQKGNVLRRHSDGVNATDLRTYRNRYAQYRTDPDLQRLHAEVPCLMTWDDHEVENDYADKWSQDGDDPEKFLMRRAEAYRAYYEHMPLRPSLSQPVGPVMRIYDKFTFGDLAQFHVLDGRQYRSKQPCYEGPRKGHGHLETNASCPERLDPTRVMLGAAQEAWLNEGLTASTTKWNMIAQDVHMAEFRQQRPDGTAYWTDDWNGYPKARERLLTRIHEAKVANPVVLTGDIHSFLTNDLKLNFEDISSPTVATEFVGTSISAPSGSYDTFAKELNNNPHIKYMENRHRGYATVELTAELCTTRYRIVSDVTDANATVSTIKTFAVQSGKPGAIEA